MNPALFSFAHICACVFTDEYICTACETRCECKKLASFPLQGDEIHDLRPAMHSCCLAGHQGILTKLNGDHSTIGKTPAAGKESGGTAEGEAEPVRSSSQLKRKLLCYVYCQCSGRANQPLPPHLIDVINIRGAVGLLVQAPGGDHPSSFKAHPSPSSPACRAAAKFSRRGERMG